MAAQLKHVLRRRPATAALRAFVLYETPCYTPDEIASPHNMTVPHYRDHEARNVRFHDFLGSVWRGKFGGTIATDSLDLRSACDVQGEVVYTTLSIESGAVVEGQFKVNKP